MLPVNFSLLDFVFKTEFFTIYRKFFQRVKISVRHF